MFERKVKTPKKENDLYEKTHSFIENDSESRTVFLVGDIEELNMRDVAERLVSLSEKDRNSPISLIISTYGGTVYDAFFLYDLMKFLPTPIHTVGLGKIMSAGCLLLAAGEKGSRKLGKNAVIMYHAGADEAAGNIFQIETRLEAFKIEENKYDTCFAKETGLTLQRIQKLYNLDKHVADRYIYPDEALKLGIVDKLI